MNSTLVLEGSSRSSLTWNFWSVPAGVLKIVLGKQIGDGFDNAVERLILKDSQNNVIDALSYVDDTSIFNPSVSLVALGSSFERIFAGFDTDLASYFKEKTVPSLGN